MHEEHTFITEIFKENDITLKLFLIVIKICR